MNLKKFTTKHCSTGAAVLAIGVLLLSACSSMRISYRRLPAQARSFIETYFPTERCVYAERERDDGRKEYEAKLSNGTDIDFYASGEWKKVDCGYSLLPAGILPQAIAADIAARYPGARAYKAERAMGGYEVKINSGLELIYSADGTLVRVDRD